MRDNEFIRPDNLTWFCNTNETLLTGEPRGIVMEFPGLGGSSCLGGLIDRGPYGGPYAQALADAGLLLVYTFSGPWSWMNKGAVRMCDLIADAAMAKYGLSSGQCPLIATGGSMGGMGALIWAADSRHRVTAVAAACPGCNQLSCWTKFDFPRTYLSAVCNLDVTIEEGMKHISPLYRIGDMPDVPYFIVGDVEDECFAIEETDDFVDRMRASGKRIDYRRLEGQKHGGFTPETRGDMTRFVIGNGTI